MGSFISSVLYIFLMLLKFSPSVTGKNSCNSQVSSIDLDFFHYIHFFCARPHVTREVLRASSSFEHATFRFVSSSPRSSYFTYLQIATPLIINQMKCSRNHGSAVWVPLNCVTFFIRYPHRWVMPLCLYHTKNYCIVGQNL